MKKIILIFLGTLLIATTTFAENIEITEIFPNPKGTDKGNEWIELYNPFSIEIDLNDYQLGNEKKKNLKNLKIQPLSYTTITTISLKNSKNYVELIDPTNTSISKIHYDNVEESKSYTKALINDSPHWLWTNTSKNLPNPTFRKLTGRITSPPQKNHFYFNNLKIYFTKDFSLPLLKILLKQDQQLQIVINSKKELISFKILSPPQIQNHTKQNNVITWLMLPLGLFVTILVFTTKSTLLPS